MMVENTNKMDFSGIADVSILMPKKVIDFSLSKYFLFIFNLK